MAYEQTIADLSKGVEVAGVTILIAGGVWSIGGFARHRGYEALRGTLGRSILVGLEVLVAADIIRTIAISPSFRSVGVLGLVVIVRTFLSLSLEAELGLRVAGGGTPAPEEHRREGPEGEGGHDGADRHRHDWRSVGPRSGLDAQQGRISQDTAR